MCNGRHNNICNFRKDGLHFFVLTNSNLDDLLVLWLSYICTIEIFIGFGDSKLTYRSIFFGVSGRTICVLISTVWIVGYPGVL